MDAPARFTIVEATTKAGKTVGCIVWLFEQAFSNYAWFFVDASGKLESNTAKQLFDKDGYNYWWVAPTHKISRIAFKRMKRFIPKALYRANASNQTITLVNGATIFFKSADDPGWPLRRGRSCKCD